eukprot:c5619_g1_i1.p1 GENE.c5619_g1_i1~~c5619_g1_i1.p1  ORF type:complete len:386 (+),score=74.76 c5619_g1_i1:96-1160(+)
MTDYQDQTHFTLAEVQHMYRHFQEVARRSGTGEVDRISRADFADALQELHITSMGPRDALLNRLYDVFDHDSNGQVSFREFLTSLSICARGSLRERVIFSFSLYDVDENGFISKEDMVESLLAMTTTMDKLSPLSGSLSAGSDSLRSEVEIRGFVDATFDECDLDADGRLSLEEFARAVEAHPVLLQYTKVLMSVDTADDRPHRYIVAVDSTAAAERAFRQVLRDVIKAGHELYVLACIPAIDMDERPPFVKKEQFVAEYEAICERHRHTVASYMEYCGQMGIEATALVETDVKNVGVRICEVATRIDADVLVLGWEGEDHAERKAGSASHEASLGAVAKFLVNSAPCSILIVK